MVIVDTSALLAAISADQHRHAEAKRAFEEDGGPYVLSPFVLAELDYFVATRAGVDAEATLLARVAAGSLTLVEFTAADVGTALAVIEQYRSLAIGLADASLVVLADRYGTNRLLTLDERHFRAVHPLGGGAFRLMPADA